MLYVVVFLVVAALVYVGWRATRDRSAKPPTRVIGPDDDPDFLWRLGRGNDQPR